MALETTLLAHGVPRDAAPALYDRLCDIVRAQAAEPRLVGVVDGHPTTRMSRTDLLAMLEAGATKVNTANLGLALHRGGFAATTVSTTMELAAADGIAVFATGGVGGVHVGYGQHWDVSADLAAFTRFPVAVVTSGVKSILDVVGTREAFETLGVPVVGYRTDTFPAFYLRESAAGVDARFDSVEALADFLSFELRRTGRGVVVANPIPEADAIGPKQWDEWLEAARVRTGGASGRDATPAILSALVAVSGGATLRANLALVEANARLAAQLAVAMRR